jgi:hypothetical protein
MHLTPMGDIYKKIESVQFKAGADDPPRINDPIK